MPSDYDDLRISFIDGEEGVADTIEIRRIGNRDNVCLLYTSDAADE